MGKLDLPQLELKKILIKGIVQGVGFRPFIYRLAQNFQVKGYIINTSNGVEIEAEAVKPILDEFAKAITSEAPPLSRIEEISIQEQKPKFYSTFEIRNSRADEGYQLISPDIAICKDCLVELFDPKDRRYQYPFINCTNCGPRFTIIQDIPYDRAKTTMSIFPMCPQCDEEYHNPLHRRFHAQPNACPTCGPHLMLTDRHGLEIKTETPLKNSINYLKEGKILAIKGLGGFHLTCNAQNNEVVELLRKRKNRPYKPFALMMKNLEDISKYCYVNSEEIKLLSSSQAPILLLKKRNNLKIAPSVAPNNNYLGVMLPYTPLHHLLLREYQEPLIMTSGNLSEEPIAFINEEALERLNNLADYFLLHNRDIHACYDDSVITVYNNNPYPIRKARGYSPTALKLNFKKRPVVVFACGADLKNSFTFIKDGYAFISQHNGDLEDYQTYTNYQRNIEIFQKLFRLEPDTIAYDLHPDYFSTLYARSLSAKSWRIPLQHHYAHTASCMADNGLNEKVIGISFDGVGYGIDGNLWGGEFMIADFNGFERVAHLQYLPLPGGDISVKKPYRIALSYLHTLLGKLPFNLELFKYTNDEEIELIFHQIDKNFNTFLTSSCGRLFDAVSSILDICQKVTYEGQAAMELEMLSEGKSNNHTDYYTFDLIESGNSWIIKLGSLLDSILNDYLKNIDKGVIGNRFHNTLAKMALTISELMRKNYGLNKVVLSGGCFQNQLLLKKTILQLQNQGFEVYIHKNVPPNDGGISLGQAVIAYVRSSSG
ncbi:MAG: Carbamoyltransferase HypF [candidate division WS2 bacterium]|nr:Carbamoyltransferase HypF [Candidatus Psychracetigena formicireducens]MBT9150232.1 Carbamoyltransferase HypF [Candidatus Psychracetigena formicireducens]